MRKKFSRAGLQARRILSWATLVVVCAALALVVLVPAATGSTPYTVLSGSMNPTYKPGSVVVVREQQVESLQVGDPITFEWDAGSPTLVTHRIVRIGRTREGELRFTTQGDANPSPDTKTVAAKQVRGKVWYAVPYGGYLKTVLGGALLIYAAVMLAGSARDTARLPRRGRRDTEPRQAEA
ncbi:signal peptidase I [Rhodococcus sp. SGAir0479]|uniref:signal peptidase I n=1 Tax=Rhodococcus sp. SGAir0479 TaxID=2567884 RepID=UPI00158669F4|nr:signal peptidase I [Rhodococcus sp. SGAir0479]